MKENPNNGFLLLSEAEEVKFKLRLDDKIYYLNVDQKGNLKSLETDSQIKCGESLEAILEVIWTVYKNYGYLFV